MSEVSKLLPLTILKVAPSVSEFNFANCAAVAASFTVKVSPFAIEPPVMDVASLIASASEWFVPVFVKLEPTVTTS